MTRERGAVTVVALTGVLTLCLFALAAADLGAMVHARARAQSAADAAALAAAVAQAPILGLDEEPAEAARAAAEANGTRLVSCSCSVGETVATVEVATSVRTILMTRWAARVVRARASAEVDGDVFSYRDD